MKNCDCKELALKKVRINGDVIGKFGTFEIEQTFLNNTKDVLNVGYTFPIVETATVVGFEINIGDKVLKGQCKETMKAKKEFQKNIVKGNSAYLMEEKNDNIFAITIGKLDKNEEVTVKIQYIDKFAIVDNTIQLLIPTLVAPRYNSKNTDKLKYGDVKYTVDFNIDVAKNLNVEKIKSATHSINVYNEDEKTRVEVNDYDMSKDFKLDIQLKNEAVSNALIFKGRDGHNEYVYMSFMPEITDTYEDSEKEYLFLIDVSGSMYGHKIEETKKAVIECLHQLDEGDKFNIIAFESDYKVLSMESMECNEKNIKYAIKRLKELEADGGTEIFDPIKFALYEQDTEKVILLFTDGEVGNEEEILEFVENNINRSRIFPFGIDYNVNSYFINELAKAGQGKAEFIMPNEKIDEKILRTFARIQTPLVEDIKIEYWKNALVDEIREDSSLFNYEYYNVFSRVKKLSGDIILKGLVAGKECSWTIKQDDVIRTDVDLEVLFAQAEIERLEKYIRTTNDEEQIENYKEMIVKISEEYNINSKYTSFLTVYERDNKILELPKYQETTLSRRNTLYDLGTFFTGGYAVDDGPVERCCIRGSQKNLKENYSIEYRVNNLNDSAPDGNDDLVVEECCIEDEMTIDDLDLSPHAYNCLKRASVNSLGDLLKKSENDLMSIKDLGKKSSDEVIEKLKEFGLSLESNDEVNIADNFEDGLREKMRTLYEEFLSDTNKSVELYLLFALYYSAFCDEDEFYNFLVENKDVILKDDKCQDLIYEIYSRSNNKLLIDYMSGKYKKAVMTNLTVIVKTDYNILSKEELEYICDKNTIKENIKDVLWTLYKTDNEIPDDDELATSDLWS